MRVEHKACTVTQEADLSLRAQGVRGQVLGANLLVVSSTVLLRAGIPTESLSKRGYLPFWTHADKFLCIFQSEEPTLGKI